ncbi:MAG TPA: Uma2 family endonuclease [Tepidisphaeraceae bacterium]|jgi:Uma2 family endonuclease|nr:Uma2 family endonuclease [Tepidisphaeraceae bacterium]
MGLPLVRKRFTPAEYYRLEHDAAYKSDYYEGEIYDMSGGTSGHSLIITNLSATLWNAVRKGPCRVQDSNLRVAILRTGLRTYPDVSIYCKPVEFDPEDPDLTTAVNPTVLFEVLSPTTERYDRGTKADHYRQIDSLVAYALVWQHQPKIEIFIRSDATWQSTIATGLTASVVVPGPGVTLSLSDVYEGVSFAEAR